MKDKKNSILILFTKTYPYGDGESFIENEIGIAARYYKKILIIACQTENKVQTRKVPDNIQVFPIIARKKINIAFSCLKNLILLGTKKELLSEWKKCHSLQKKIFCLYFYSKVEYIEKLCNAILKKYMVKETNYTLYSYWFFDLAYLALRLKRQFKDSYNVNFITRAHGYDLYEYRNKLGYFPFRLEILEDIDMVFPCSIDGESYLKKTYPTYASKFQKSYLGTSDFGKKSIHYPRKKTTIVTCSNLIALKRVGRLPLILKKIEEKGYPLEWICFGDGPERGNIEEKCRKYLKNSKVIFKGKVNNQEIMEFYQKEEVDIFINLSTTEGLPVSIMEEMSFGIPAIATDVGGTSEIVVEGKTGILLNGNFDDAELESAILEIIVCGVEKKEQLRQNCREYWKHNFHNISNYEAFYKILLNFEENDNAICNQ